jgi:DNA polymerase III epsilon subunit-like protein
LHDHAPRQRRAVSTGGLQFQAYTPLLKRALETVSREPMGTPDLAREVFGLMQAPPGLASRLVFDLLGEDSRFSVDSEGIWTLVEVPVTAGRLTLSDTKFAVVDVETTGSSVSSGARVVEFSAVLVDGFRAG